MNVHKKVLMTTIAAVLIAAMGIFAGCKKDEDKVKNATGVGVCPTAVMVYANSTATLTATVFPSDADDRSVTWTSDKTNVATVADGVVTALAAGDAVITCTTNDGGFTATSVVIVNPVKDDDDYATLVPSFYYGDMTMEGEIVGQSKLITIKYSSKDEISLSIDETFKVPQMGNMEVPMQVDCIADMTKVENGYKAEGETEAPLPVIGNLPVKIDAIFDGAGKVDMNINIELPVSMGGGSIIVNFKGTGQSVIDCALED
jgi:hypothetical protein